MIGGFFCGPKTKRVTSKSLRKTSGNKTKKASLSKSKKSKSLSKTNGNKVVRSVSKSKKSKSLSKKVKSAKYNRCVTKCKKSQKGGASVGFDVCDPLGRGTYPVAFNSHTDCSGVHHK